MAETPNRLNLFDPEIDQEQPQHVYAMRARQGIAFNPDGKSATISAMADILAVNMHKDVTARSPGAPSSMGGLRPLIPLDLDGDEHTKYRKLLDPLFAPKQVALLEPNIRALSNDLIERFIDNGRADLFSEFCQPLPGTIFISLLGLPLSELPYFLRFKDYAIRAPGETPEEMAANRDQAGRDMADRLYREIELRRRESEPRSDLIAGFLEVEVDGHRLSDDDIVDICYLLVIAGLDTVAGSLSCILHWLARHPAEQQRLRDEPALLAGAIEELMRYESPVPGGGRYANEDIDINGTKIPAGTQLQVSWACANVDEAEFPNALTVDFERPVNRHIAFASGFHRCLGSHLARLELRVAIEQFQAWTAHYWIPDDDQPRIHNVGVRSVEYLPVAFEPAA